MSAQYSRDHCKIAVAKILQMIGWHSINSTPLEVLTDIVQRYVQQISRLTMDFANEFGQTEGNLDHLGLAFQEMGVNISELEEYTRYVNFAPSAQPVPKFPIPKEDNLNFLKPGSKEVVTRPVHIPEHLPPMFPLLEESCEKVEDPMQIKAEVVEEEKTDAVQEFKKPAAVSPEFRRPKREDEGGRPTREISSVMMTTSGFLSPAREGKLPEAKAPVPPPVVEPPPPPVAPSNEPVVKKKVKEKNKDKLNKELFKPIPEEKVAKKVPTMKDLVKMKQKTTSVVAQNVPPLAGVASLSPHLPHEGKFNVQKALNEKFDKALAAAKAKTEKLNTTITPIPSTIPPLPSSITLQQVEKLFNEPDKKKVNILKKISNVKEAKGKKDSRSNTPSLVIEDHTDIVNKISLSSDITIEPIHSAPAPRRSPEKYEIFDDGSPPGTPLTPRTPELVTHSPPVLKEKRKRKDTRKVKRVKKGHHFIGGTEIIDLAAIGRPKTPEAHLPMGHRGHMPPHIPFPFPINFGGPGLIPSMNTPLFPFSHLNTFGKNPYFPSVPPPVAPPQVEPVSLVSPKAKDVVEMKPMEVTPLPQPPPKPKPTPVQNKPQSPAPPPIEIAPSVPPPPVTVAKDVNVVTDKKPKEHKKEKKDKIKKKNKKDKVKEKSEKKKLKELKKDVKEKIKKEKKVKKKEKLPTENLIPKMILKVNSPSPRPETPESIKKLNIKPIVKKDEPSATSSANERHREPSPAGLAKIAALVTGPPKTKTNLSPVAPVAPPPAPAVEKAQEDTPQAPPPRTPARAKSQTAKPKTPKPRKVEQTFKKIDEHGNEVWICPACGQQDDGRPMIGCDGCDAWYHWVCVGIQVPPDENENWYCKPCLCKKNEDLQSDKKRKRKKKEKKEH